MARHGPSQQAPIVVVGGGIAGLTAAALLAARGEPVVVLESQPVVGGKIRQLLGVDSGPTVMTMRWVFDEIFSSCGARLDERLTLEPLQILARHAWKPGAYGFDNQGYFDLYADQKASIDSVARFFGLQQAAKFVAFCTKAKQIHDLLEPLYIQSARPSFFGLTRSLGLKGLTTLASLGPLANLWQSLGDYFPDPRLRQLFGRYATYCGSSPWLAPATLMLIAQVEMAGVWSIRGGMIRLAEALAQLAQERGATLLTNAKVCEVQVESHQVCAVTFDTPDGRHTLPTRDVIFNGDAAALYQVLSPALRIRALIQPSPPRPVPAHERSLSAVTWSIRTTRPLEGFNLSRHNLFFDDGYQQEFTQVFNQQRLPGNATIYLCAQDRTDQGLQPERPTPGERVLVLINAPAIGDHSPETFSQANIDQLETHHFARLKLNGLSISPQDATLCETQITTPREFSQLFPATGGALYGQPSHGWFSQFRRLGSQGPVAGLWMAGGSVHPGPGVPMAALSGLRAAEALMASRDSTARSRRGVTAGGTSMQSVQTNVTPLP